jgi:NAD(P)-dependent dehydrogenase (short-subunit alcohol dehydrogenase family)
MSNEEVNGDSACVGSLSFNGSDRRLEGKVAIITGGAMGIGEAIVRLFTKHGAKVIIADFADEAGKNLAEQLSPLATYVHCDVSKEQDISAVVDLAIEKHGQLDIMYNNAGINDTVMGKSVAEYDMEQFDRVMSVNVRGVMLGIKHAARVMIPRKKGCIISTGSLASMLGGLSPYSYTAAKHAVIGLTKNGAAELGKYGIRVNAVSPSGVATPFTAKMMRGGADSSSPISEKEKALIEGHSNRIGNLQGPTLKVEDIAGAGLYLASDEAKYVSGHNLVVDGGFTVVNHSWGLYRP